MSVAIESTCPRGGFFDGNENFGGPPYRGFITLLSAAPILFLIGSSVYWYILYRRQKLEQSNRGIQNGVVVPGMNTNVNVNDQSNYQTMNDQHSSSSSSTQTSFSNIDLNADDHPVIDSSLYYDSDPESPNISAAVNPISSPSPLPSSSTSSSSSSSTSTNKVALLSAVAPSPRESSVNNNVASSSSSFSVESEITPSRNSPVSTHTQILLFLRSLIRPKKLFTISFIMSCVQFITTLATLIYAVISGEQCCYGGTGALYAILCLRLYLSYSNIRVGHWQTNSRLDKISVIDKSCQIGYLIHYIWLSFAFTLVNDDGQCRNTAPVMFNVSLISIILLLVNYGVFGIFTLIQYFSQSRSDLMIVLSRTCIKLCFIGWAYGRALDLNDAITDIEMEIACLPCITYDDMIVRDKEKGKRRQLYSYAYDIEKANGSNIKIDSESQAESNSNAKSDSNNNNIDDAELETLSCAICLNSYEKTDMIRPLPCGHHLHKSCSDHWLKVKSTCPLCVRSVLVQ